ncbi:amino acid permease [Chitinophaga sedimenti]|uniref:APC family permease n=1 Tax=Chitinophaga sedimenti TaxID=2033606 RepID=UPI0020054AEF|nr:amino acid permease [Chitinophaga sedimenti]MCK7554871.1 amino acid permease [Chitinophaga sedimenti]
MDQPHLSRRISLLQATAINMTDMVGIGPFIVLSLVAKIMNGPGFLYAWIAGAVLSFIDAMVWSELGATFPKAGGSYNFLKEGFGPRTGRLMSFLFVWQTMIQAPLVISSAAIGFSGYASYLLPLGFYGQKLVSGGVVILIILLLYRRIETIGKISVLLWMGVLITMAWIIGSGFAHGNFMAPIHNINTGLELNYAFGAALGVASVKTMYSYLGYYNVCHLGGEITSPERNIPRSMFISITGITILYLCMNISVASVLPMDKITASKYVVSDFIETLAGPVAAVIVTIMILWVAFASVFSATLGYSRIPYAAAQDGAFFRVFGKLHPTRNFPHISLLFLGGVAFVFSLLVKLEYVISAILAMRILVQFMAQAVGLILLSRRAGRSSLQWRMPLYPLPVILALLIWGAVFVSTGTVMMLTGISFAMLGIVVYFIKESVKKGRPL